MPTLTVPFGGSNVIPEGEGPSRHPADAPAPPVQRKSLHTVRIAAPSAPEYKPEWKENGQLKWVPAEPPPTLTDSNGNGIPDYRDPEIRAGETGTQPYEIQTRETQPSQPLDALHQEIAELKQTMQLMAQAQLGGGQPPQPQGPQPPNPEDFDFYEPRQVAEFHKLNNAYIQATVQQSVQQALAPHEGAMQAAEYSRQYNSVLADYGNDPNFKPYMDKALQMVAKSNGKYSIPEAYDLVASLQINSPHQAAPSPSANPAQRTITAQEAAQKAAQARSLPPRNGVSGAGEPALPASLMNVGALGRIMLHNQQTGRARPI